MARKKTVEEKSTVGAKKKITEGSALLLEAYYAHYKELESLLKSLPKDLGHVLSDSNVPCLKYDVIKRVPFFDDTLKVLGLKKEKYFATLLEKYAKAYAKQGFLLTFEVEELQDVDTEETTAFDIMLTFKVVL